jgi:hypothetical protein
MYVSILLTSINVNMLNLIKVNIHIVPSCISNTHACMRDKYICYVSTILKIFPTLMILKIYINY